MSELSRKLLASPRLQDILRTMAVHAVGEEIGLSEPGAEPSLSELNFALMAASALTAENEERSQDAVLRIAHAVLRNPAATDDEVAAAIVLLDRVGNQLAIELAKDRYERAGVDYDLMPRTIAMDALARRQQLSVTVNGAELDVNPFQRDFWSLVHDTEWVSVSAPTSAGKSHIVREWMRTEIQRGERRQLVYVAPTRALVEEVGASFRLQLDKSVGVHTLPWDPDIAEFERQIFVMTQERLHLLQERSPHFAPEVIFIDEAQKISEGSRGILLTQVLDEAVLRNADVRLVFASPLSENPGVLLGGSPAEKRIAAIVGESVTVSQNLIYVTQKYRRPQIFDFTLVYQGDQHFVGDLTLARRPDNVGQRIAYVAAAVGGLSLGNLVYANGPKRAEEYARVLYEALGPEADLEGDAIQELVDFARGTVHQRYELGTFARRGVAFHYGDMPLVLKAKVEDLFRRGAIRYLVCTSTLLEGVNLPCRNIFMRGPKKGQDHLTMADFWNLAGRAGRWGKEFQGNIFCIDTSDDRAWPNKPNRRERSRIALAAAEAVKQLPSMLAYIEDGAPKSSDGGTAVFESTFSWLSGRVLTWDTLDTLTGVDMDPEGRHALRSAVSGAVSGIRLPDSLVRRHAGISPLSMQRLFDALLEHGRPAELSLLPPTSDGAQRSYEIAFEYIDVYLGGSFYSPNRRLQLAGLVVNWMRGIPLSRIIDGRASYRRRKGIDFNYPDLIRSTLQDVEDIARFEAPKYLSCFSDVVGTVASELGHELDDQVEDIEMMLELGVPRRTDMSLIAAGLSRATVRELENYLLDPDMSPAEAREWLRTVDVESLAIPAFASRELSQVRSLLAARLWA